ncbi:CRM-domain containing factor CFM2, chloroplastic isoform X2 [Primulina tabacum]|uniref:CRM-domain containing factor CFM2, chloroplastic isoform X2 n=1 Tax=Primulina tabacum TaxID=48773 RepID=UPI003F5A1ABE
MRLLFTDEASTSLSLNFITNMMISSCHCNRNFPLYLPSFSISVFGCSKLPLSPGQQRTPVGVSAALAADTQTLPQSAIQRIAEKLRSLGYLEVGINNENPEETPSSCPVSPSPGEIFVPLRSHLPKHRVGHTLDPSWSMPGNPVPEPGSGDAIQRFQELRRVVLKEKEEERLRNQKKERAPTLAELTLPVDEIKRLTSLGIGLKKKLKVGKAGITEGIVNGIHERWRRYEVVRIACEDICKLNMKRTHDLLERKTGGLVIWRSGSNIILYRGAEYKYPYFFADNNSSDDSSSGSSPDIKTDEGVNGEIGMSSQGNKAVESPVHNSCMRISRPPLVQGVGLPDRVRFQLPGEALLTEEAEKLLEGLGPRFTDWWGYDPLPVDADLLPAIVPGYRRPFRLLPYGVKPKLTNDEMTTLRRLGLPLPCHFALGRNRKLQGLAASIVKLWEKCEIAKIAIKRGVQNTNSELMAEELKGLTGGTLLSRDREFISLYRGKDFLPVAVSSAIEARRQGRLAVSQPRTDNNTIINTKENAHVPNEYSPGLELNEQKDQKCHGPSEPRRLRLSEAAIGRTGAKLDIALAKKSRAEKLLEDLGKEEISQPSEADKEGITEEERYMLRRIGLKMGPFLLMGRRGVFDGTVENMHLHWKYRELVKVLIGRRSIEEVHQVAQTLEAESGGILVAVEGDTKGYAIIIYRGKNYKRPATLRPRTLLSKREALKRSLEAQRRQSLKLHVLELTKNIDELKLKMAKDKDTNNLLLAKDLKLGFDKEQETGEIYVNVDKSFEKDLNSEEQSHYEDLAEEIMENQETDTNSAGQEDFVLSSKGSASVGRLDLTTDILHSNIDGKEACDMPREEPPPVSVPKDLQDSLKIAEQRIDFSLRREDQVNTSATTLIQPQIRDSKINRSKANLEHSAGKATQNESAFYRATQLSNRERLILRKQALRMKNRPVLAIGKRNIMSGIARTINTHFMKHSLAIVSIKGRADGTSIREVVHSLEQATGSVLVSQEPSKVILYKPRGSEVEPIQDGENTKLDSKNYRVNVVRKDQGLVSPELISAIRMECGLKLSSEATDDGGSG